MAALVAASLGVADVDGMTTWLLAPVTARTLETSPDVTTPVTAVTLPVVVVEAPRKLQYSLLLPYWMQI